MDILREEWSAVPIPRRDVGLVVFDDDNVSAPTLEGLLGATGINLHTARMPFPTGPDHAADLAATLGPAAASILPSSPPRIIAFACTTGAVQLGPDRLRQAVCRPGCDIEIVTPFDALVEALNRLKVRRVSVVSPYSESVSRVLGDHLVQVGFELPGIAYFDADNAHIPDISADSIIAAARRVAAFGAPDALFLSCTGMRATPLIERLEDELDLSVLTSLQVMAARIAALMGVELSGPGRLFGG